MVNTTGLELVLVVVNPSSSGGLPTSYSITISNSSYGYSNSTPAFLNGSAMVTFTGLTIGTNYTISAVAINCAGSSNPTTIYISCKYKVLWLFEKKPISCFYIICAWILMLEHSTYISFGVELLHNVVT